MTWVRFDEGFPEHPKVIAAGPLAAWLHVCAIAYSNRHLTDGLIPVAVLPRLSDGKRNRPLAAALVDVGLWEVVDGGWLIHDFLQYQPSKAKVEAERAAARDRMQNVRKSSRNVRPNIDRTNGEVRPKFALPDPTRPDPRIQVLNDDDSVDTPDTSSSSDLPTIAGLARHTAEALAAKRPDLTNRPAWIARTTEGLLRERLPEINRCIGNGYSTETAVALLTTIEPPTLLKPAWEADPHCELCDGTGWTKNDDGYLIECACRRREPYEATVTPIRREAQ